MSNLNKLISKAIMDDDFRSEFLKNPIETAKDFNLTEVELLELRKVDFTELEAVDNQLEERISKSFLNLPELGDEGDYHSSHGAHGSHDNADPHNSSSSGSW